MGQAAGIEPKKNSWFWSAPSHHHSQPNATRGIEPEEFNQARVQYQVHTCRSALWEAYRPSDLYNQPTTYGVSTHVNQQVLRFVKIHPVHLMATLCCASALQPGSLAAAEKNQNAEVSDPAPGLLEGGSPSDGDASGSPDPTEPQPPAASPPWRATLELYGLAPLQLDTRTTINGFTTTVEMDLGDVLSHLDWTSSLRGSVEQGRIGLLTDLSYTKLGAENARTTPRGLLTGRAKIAATQGIYDLAVRYRFGEPEAAVGAPGQFSLIPYAGVRVIDAQLDTEVEIIRNGQSGFARNGNFGRTWAQPLLGTQATVFLSPRLRAFARADIGGFGLSGRRDLSGNAQVGLGYAIGNSTDLNISWRYLGIEYENDKSPRSGFKSTQNGIELGLKFFF